MSETGCLRGQPVFCFGDGDFLWTTHEGTEQLAAIKRENGSFAA